MTATRLVGIHLRQKIIGIGTIVDHERGQSTYLAWEVFLTAALYTRPSDLAGSLETNPTVAAIIASFGWLVVSPQESLGFF